MVKIKILNARNANEVIVAGKVAETFKESSFEGLGRSNYKMYVNEGNLGSPSFAAWWVDHNNITVRVCYGED